MYNFLNQIITILTTPPGNLTYHLVLAFTIAGAIPAALYQSRLNPNRVTNRLLLGLYLLLAARLVQFLLAGAAWQGLLNTHLLLPPVDRAITLLSLVVIVWLWAFPEPNRLADAGAILLGLLSIALSALAFIWWSGQTTSAVYNQTLSDQLAQGAAVALTLFGLISLWIRRPTGWWLGLTSLFLLLLGHALHFWIAPAQGDLSGLVRLGQVLAYPFLLALPQRLVFSPAPTSDAGAALPESAIRRTLATDPQLLDSYLDLGAAPPDQVCRALVRTVAHTTLADICMLLSQPTPQGLLDIVCAYDLIREEWFEAPPLDTAAVPKLMEAILAHQPLRLPPGRDAADLFSLAGALKVARSGSLLAAPLITRDGVSHGSLLLLSPHTVRTWNAVDEARLLQIAQSMAQLLQQSHVQAELQTKLEAANRHTLELERQAHTLQTEVDELHSQLQTTHAQEMNTRAQAESLAAIIASYEEAEATISSLQSELETLRQGASLAAPGEFSEPVDSSSLADQQTGELRLALEEVANLRAALAEAELKLLAQESLATPANPPDSIPAEVAALVQELRQPMASILGYTEILLGESLGILGAKQRKFLEKVKIASERFTGIADELARLTSPASAPPTESATEIDLYAAVDQAVAQTSGNIQEKAITITVDLPEGLPNLQADQDAFQQVLVELLANAARVTPSQGEVVVSARLQADNVYLDYMLVQVSDQGGGIPPEDIPRIFSPLTPNETGIIPGVSTNGGGLAGVRSLVESLGGRIWIDSTPGAGATFSILLPVTPEPASGDLQGLFG